MHIFPQLTEKTTGLPIYPDSVGSNFDEKGINRLHGYYSDQWIQFHSGYGHFHHRGRIYDIKPGMGIFMPKDDPHAYFPSSSPWLSSWVSFQGHSVSEILTQLGLTKTTVYTLKDSQLLYNMIQKIYNQVLTPTAISHVESSSYLYYFLTVVVNNATPFDEQSSFTHLAKLQPAFDYIDSNYMGLITLEELATVMDITPQHLCHLFKQGIGQRPLEYINLVRVRNAQSLLLSHPEKSIMEIAKIVGYDDPSYFGRVFKRYLNITPNQFRKVHNI